ncbi:uncharacterized protein LOC135805999 [Sycon ciliatum]|uniref:uncharacterized protein LOC135805999 n=1 Tax=Sycon ciliatum TaxID=27933 RepID=UPI0020ACBAA1|eukprot:scpid63290/ scgid18091/ 
MEIHICPVLLMLVLAYLLLSDVAQYAAAHSTLGPVSTFRDIPIVPSNVPNWRADFLRPVQAVRPVLNRTLVSPLALALSEELENTLHSEGSMSGGSASLARLGLHGCSSITGIHLLQGNILRKTANRVRKTTLFFRRHLLLHSSITTLLYTALVVFKRKPTYSTLDSDQAYPTNTPAAMFKIKVTFRARGTRIYNCKTNISLDFSSALVNGTIEELFTFNIKDVLPYVVAQRPDDVRATRRKVKLFLHIRPTRETRRIYPWLTGDISTIRRPTLVFVRGADPNGSLSCKIPNNPWPLHVRISHNENLYRGKEASDKPIHSAPHIIHSVPHISDEVSNTPSLPGKKRHPSCLHSTCSRVSRVFDLTLLTEFAISPNLLLTSDATRLDMGLCIGSCRLSVYQHSSCDKPPATNHAKIVGHILGLPVSSEANDIEKNHYRSQLSTPSCVPSPDQLTSKWLLYAVSGEGASEEADSYIDSGIVLVPRLLIPLVDGCSCV